MHPILAIRAFFAILFGRAIAIDILKALPIPNAVLDAAKDGEARVTEERPALPRATAEARPKAAPEAVAVQALAVFQSEGRLLDFLLEDIEGYTDEDIGAAVREVHRGCRRALEDHFKLVPVRSEEEESRVTVPEGYDPAEIRLVGNVVGKPPFSGTLKHRGWRAAEVRLPQVHDGPSGLVLTPAEVEI